MGLLPFFQNLVFIDSILSTDTSLIIDSEFFSPYFYDVITNYLLQKWISILSFHLRAKNFSKANVNAIRKTVNYVDSERWLNELYIDERVKFLTECILNIFHNFLPTKAIIIRNKDALWINREIKRMILEKAKI